METVAARPGRRQETVLHAVSPAARLARLGEADRRLLLLLSAQDLGRARALLEGLAPERLEVLGPLAAEIAALPSEVRRELLARELTGSERRPDRIRLNLRLARERPRLAGHLVTALAPRRAPQGLPAPTSAEPRFRRTLERLALIWRGEASR